jgi:arylsulfatase A-like enzyme
MSTNVTRRDFLKLASLLPLLRVDFPDLLSAPAASAGNSNTPNILVLVFDTLSAKHMSLYGYDRATTPNLDRFAEKAVVYHNHYSSGNFTSPGTASMLTGVYPWTHRAFNLHGTVSPDFDSKNIFSLLPGHIHRVAYTHNLLVTSFLTQFQKNIDRFINTRELSLADEQFSDRLFPADYNASFWSETMIFRGGGSKPSSLFLSMMYKLSRLATKQDITRDYGSLFPRGVPNLNDIYFLMEDAIDWLMEQVVLLPQPYFAYIHLLPPHEPYTARRDFVDIFQDGFKPIEKPESVYSEGHPARFLNQQRREYDEYLAYADAEFGRLLDFLYMSGAMDNTYLVITSDHGELFERGIRGHVTKTLYDPLIHVPLLISRPGQQQRQDVYAPTSCVDLVPTLLKITGGEIPEWCEGLPLPALGGNEKYPDRQIFAIEAKGNAKYAPITKATLVSIREGYKLHSYIGKKGEERKHEMFDLRADPDELVNLLPTGASTATDLMHEMDQVLARINQPYFAR